MAKPFKGVINIDVRDSTQDWSPYEAPVAPKGAPNVLYIVLDDVGFSSMSCYGGPIATPTFDRLAKNGMLYTQWHTTALCSPTRSCLLTGRNHTLNGMACIEEGTTGFPGSNGHIPFENATLAEMLVERGYSTYALGKWHLCPVEETNMAATKRNWPLGRGFERYYGFLGGETNQWYPDLVYDNHPIEPPKTPEEGYHLTPDLVDKAIEFIRDAKGIAPDKPFFLYLAPGACHAPHQVPKDWAERYTGQFDMGYEQMREQTLARQKAMGIVPPDTELPPINPIGTPDSRKGPEDKPFPITDFTRPWDSLSAAEKKLFARMAEVFAGFLSHTDYHVGRLLQYLEHSGQLDNTLVVLVSDNGASGEGGPEGSVNENKFFNGIPDDIEQNLQMLDELGGVNTYNHYCNGWAMAFNTPFKLWKRYNLNGGTADACIISWPQGMQERGGIRQQYHHAIDIVPTVLDCLGMTAPEEVKGFTQTPVQGVSMRYTFTDAETPTQRITQFYTMLGSRGIYHLGWKAVTDHPTLSDWGHFLEDNWELYHTDADRSECHELVRDHPVKLRELIALWYIEAGANNGLPLDDRTPLQIITAARPQPVAPRNRYMYFPDTAGVPESVAVNMRNRSFTIGVLADITESNAQGVLFAFGSRFGGQTLYLKEHKLHYVNNFVGITEQRVSAESDVPSGENLILSASFEKQGEDPPGVAFGTLSLYLNDRQLGAGAIKLQPGSYGLDAFLTVGRALGASVTHEYDAPFPFTGGTIKRLVVDVSGEPYLNLEREAERILRRS